MNEVKLIGKVFKTPELKFTDKGTSFIKNFILVSRNNNKKEHDLIPFIMWGDLAEEFASTVVEKTIIEVSGKIRSGSYIDKIMKIKKYTLDVLVNKFLIKDETGEGLYIFSPLKDDEDIPF